MSGEMIDAAEALRIGLADVVIPHADLLSTVRNVAAVIAAKPPLAVATIKRAILRGQDAPLATGNELEATAFGMLFGTHDQRRILEQPRTLF